MVGSQGVNQGSITHMLYAIEAMAPAFFNWVEALLPIFKDQLTKCWQGELKQFGFGSFLACFFFERVLQMRPQVVFTELRARDPRMQRWVYIMACTRAGRGKVKFGDSFFRWLRDRLLMVEDYAYAVTNFSGYPDLPLPPGGQWGDIGKKQKP